MTCGTTKGYRDGCRCAECRKAHAEAQRRYRDRNTPQKSTRPPYKPRSRPASPPPPCGTRARYKSLRSPCRCILCKQAANEYQRAYRQRLPQPTDTREGR